MGNSKKNCRGYEMENDMLNNSYQCLNECKEGTLVQDCEGYNR